MPATSNILMSLPTICSAVKEPDGRVRKTSMPNLTGSTPSCSPSLAAMAASTAVAVGLLSMRVSVIMAESSSLAWVSVGSTPMTSNSLATMEQEEPQGSATMCSGAAVVKSPKRWWSTTPKMVAFSRPATDWPGSLWSVRMTSWGSAPSAAGSMASISVGAGTPASSRSLADSAGSGPKQQAV
ncbi:Uncharacterised protein [Collinsella intestinalis]|nr:Uncharacterised protein [Collinsella intestinalis]